MFDSIATLRAETVAQDAELNEVVTYTDREVFVHPASVRMSEFYQAANAGLKPELILVLANFADYQGERVVLFDGKEYTVLRTYQRPDRDNLELTLEERVENGA